MCFSMSDHPSLMPVYMAADIDSDRESRDVRGIGQDPDGECRRTPAKTCRADAGLVDLLKDGLLQFPDMGKLRVTVNGQGQGVLCHLGTLLKVAANADADDHRRTGVGACVLYGSEDRADHTLLAICRSQHEQSRLVLRAKALRRHGDRHLITRHNLLMEDAGGIILRIHAKQRVRDHGLSKIEELYPGIRIISSSEEVVTSIGRIMSERDMLAGENDEENFFYASDLSENFVNMIKVLLGSSQDELNIRFKSLDM